MDRYQESRRVTTTGAWVNLSLAILKTSVGLIGRSPALFADGIHSLSDVVSDFFVLVAARVSNKGVDYNHPYGHQRIETLATIGLSVLLMLVGVGIAYEALENIIQGSDLIPDSYTVGAAILSVAANEWLFHYTMRAGRRINSDMLKANAWHNRSDALSSLVVLAGLVGALLGFPVLDAVAALFVCVLIVKMGVTWLVQSFSELVDTGVDQNTVKAIEQAIMGTGGVKGFHQLRTRRMAGKAFLDVHVLVDNEISVSEGHHIGEHVRANIQQAISDVEDITVHIDVDNHQEQIPQPSQLTPLRQEIVVPLMQRWQAIMDTSLIHHVNLKYFRGEVEVTLVLDEAVLSKYDYTALARELEATCDEMGCLKAVHVQVSLARRV